MQIKGVLLARLEATLSVLEHYLCNVKFKTMLCKHVTRLGRDDDHELYGYAYMQQSLSVICDIQTLVERSAVELSLPF